MSLPNWPADLPQEWFDPTTPPTIAPDDNTIRSTVSSGPAKLRRRFTAQTEDVVLNNTLNETELDILKDFVKDTLCEVKQFIWVDFEKSTKVYVNYRFKQGWASVKKTHLGGDMWTVTIELEKMP